jgi:YggT family protein
VCGQCLFIVFVEAFINVLGGAVTLVIFARAVVSWIPEARLPQWLHEFVWGVTEPIYAPIRRLVPPRAGIDFTPFLALLLVILLENLLLRILPPAV